MGLDIICILIILGLDVCFYRTFINSLKLRTELLESDQIDSKNGTQKCQYCREIIKYDATVCPHCLRKQKNKIFENNFIIIFSLTMAIILMMAAVTFIIYL